MHVVWFMEGWFSTGIYVQKSCRKGLCTYKEKILTLTDFCSDPYLLSEIGNLASAMLCLFLLLIPHFQH